MAEKATTGLVVGLFAYIVGEINMVTAALFLFILVDFFTGLLGTLTEAIQSEQNRLKENPEAKKKPPFWWFDDKKAQLGIIKKFGILFLWFISVIIQLVIVSQGHKVGISFSTPYITLAMTFYLLGTETMSITRNLSKMNVTAPKWITRIAECFKRQEVK